MVDFILLGGGLQKWKRQTRTWCMVSQFLTHPMMPELEDNGMTA
jgi:hypothetical protein